MRKIGRGEPALRERAVLDVEVLDVVVGQGAEAAREVLEPDLPRVLPALEDEYPVVEEEEAHRLLERRSDEHRLETLLAEDRAVRRPPHEIEETLSDRPRHLAVIRR